MNSSSSFSSITRALATPLFLWLSQSLCLATLWNSKVACSIEPYRVNSSLLAIS